MTDEQSVDYGLLGTQLDALTKDESDMLANSANFVALVYNAMPDINWLGMYVLRDTELVLGPFQGKPACVRIPLGRGVCGTAARELKTIRVTDVDEFDGHIVCDPESKSEIVVPLISEGHLLGVIDIDSPQRARFSVGDQAGVESLCSIFIKNVDSATGFI